MAEKAPFSEIFLQAWKASSPRATTLVFGALVACGMATEQVVAQALGRPDQESIASALRGAWGDYAGELSALLAIVLLAHVFGQANLIAALSSRKRQGFRLGDISVRFAQTLAVDAVAVAIVAVLMLVFASPALIALLSNQSAFHGAAFLGALAFLPVLFAGTFIRQYGLFYYLLSPLCFRDSIDRGTALFLKYVVRSFAFWLFSFALAAAFTFLVNAAMLGTSSLFTAVGLKVFSGQAATVAGFVGLVWFAIFDQALTLRFFEDLASEKGKEDVVSGEQVLDPSMPVA